MSSSPAAVAAVAAATTAASQQDEQPNDSPAFRLRPRRAAPKSYYTVRLEYSANPSAFIRQERPKVGSKRKVFSSKTGSQRASGGHDSAGSAALKLATIVSKEERELEARRLLLQREISESITADKMISPFMQRLSLDELAPDSIYEHNYITLRIKKIGRSTNGQLAHCLCETVDEYDEVDDDNDNDDDDDDTDVEDNNEAAVAAAAATAAAAPNPDQDNPPRAKFTNIAIRLYNEYAQTALLKPGKLISIAKFKTSPALSWQSQNASTDALDEQAASSADSEQTANPSSSTTTNVKDNNQTKRLPFMIIVKYDELLSTGASKNSFNNQQSSNAGAAAAAAAAASSGRLGGGVCDDADYSSASANKPNSLNTNTNNKNKTRRTLIPFISITDMIESVEEPFVEMGPSSPAHTTNFAGSNSRYNNNNVNYNNDLIKRDNCDEEENKESKKIKFTATPQQQQQQQHQLHEQPQH